MKSKVLSLGLGVVLGLASFSCSHGLAQLRTEKSEAFGREIDNCRDRSQTCSQMMACQHDAQRKFGYPVSGYCELSPVDAGADSSGGLP